MKQNGGSAFPSPHDEKMYGPMDKGMTLRDYFAAHACVPDVSTEPESAARWAYRYADALLAERSK